MQNRNRYVFEEDGSLIRLTESCVAGADALLKSIRGNVPVKTKNAFEVCGWLANVSTNDTASVVSIELKEVRIDTEFRLVDGVLVPVFAGPDTVRTVAVWAVPENMDLIMGIKCKHVSGSWRMEDAVLFATAFDLDTEEAKGNWRLPLPNTYDDGRLCLGPVAGTFSNRSLAGLTTKILQHFNTSPWNNELPADLAKTAQLFRFRPDDNSPIPPPSNWRAACRRCSHAIMRECT